MRAKITRTIENLDEKMQLKMQGNIYENVSLLHSGNVFALPQNGDDALLLNQDLGNGGAGFLALPFSQKLAGSNPPEIKNDATYLLSRSGAQIILQDDGSIILKPASGKNLYIDGAQGKKRILQEGDMVTIPGGTGTPVAGMIALTTPET